MSYHTKSSRFNRHNISGLRVVVAAFGVFCGITGIISGIFEIAQGNTTTNGFEISIIGSNYVMYDDFTYFAVTIIPNFLLTGIIAIIVSSLVIVWSVFFIHKKYGSFILLFLSITQMLVGGGWVIDLALVTCIISIGIDRPLIWWRTHFPLNLRIKLEKLYPFSLVLYSIVAISMNVLSILGVNDSGLIDIITTLAAAMIIIMPLFILSGLAKEIQGKEK